jgi:Spy/CpxP family protein refolding chaperone
MFHRGLEDKMLADRLGLTAEQREKIGQLLPRQGFPRGGRLPPWLFREMTEAERKEALAQGTKRANDLRAVLTPEQQQKWEELLGPRVNRSRLANPAKKAPGSKAAEETQKPGKP